MSSSKAKSNKKTRTLATVNVREVAARYKAASAPRAARQGPIRRGRDGRSKLGSKDRGRIEAAAQLAVDLYKPALKELEKL